MKRMNMIIGALAIGLLAAWLIYYFSGGRNLVRAAIIDISMLSAFVFIACRTQKQK